MAGIALSLMKLTELQARLLDELQKTLGAKPNQHAVYCTEWLGFLPYGAYHWLEVSGHDISRSFPAGWQLADIEALEIHGHLEKTAEWQNPQDEYERKITYALKSKQRSE